MDNENGEGWPGAMLARSAGWLALAADLQATKVTMGKFDLETWANTWLLAVEAGGCPKYLPYVDPVTGKLSPRCMLQHIDPVVLA